MHRSSIITLALIPCLVGACPDQQPDVVVPPDNPPSGEPLFADVVLSFTAGTMSTNCISGGFPTCNGTTMETGPCAGFPALGENDGVSFPLGVLARVELGFLCNSIVEVGVDPASPTGASTDFVVWGTASPDSIPVVEIGDDGVSYVSVNPWPKKADGTYVTNGGFQLEAAARASARFVRISNSASVGTIQVDALEAVPRLQ